MFIPGADNSSTAVFFQVVRCLMSGYLFNLYRGEAKGIIRSIELMRFMCADFGSRSVFEPVLDYDPIVNI